MAPSAGDPRVEEPWEGPDPADRGSTPSAFTRPLRTVPDGTQGHGQDRLGDFAGAASSKSDVFSRLHEPLKGRHAGQAVVVGLRVLVGVEGLAAQGGAVVMGDDVPHPAGAGGGRADVHFVHGGPPTGESTQHHHRCGAGACPGGLFG